MATVADLLIQIGADTSDLKKQLEGMERELKRIFGAEIMKISERAAGAIGGFAESLGSFGISAVQAAGELEQTRVAFKNLLHSAEGADAFIAQMQDFAARTPFEFNDVTKAAQKFKAFGFETESIIPALTAVGDATAAMGKGADAVNSVALALGQMKAKARVQSGEMMQLTNVGISAWDILAEKIGVTVPEAMDMVSKGMVDADSGIAALVAGMGERYKGAMEQQSQTLLGSWSTLTDGMEQSTAAVGEKIASALNVTGILQYAGDSFSKFAQTVRTSGVTEALLSAVPPEVEYTVIALGTAITTVAVPAIIALGAHVLSLLPGLAALVTTVAPWTLALGAAATAVVFLYRQGVRLADVFSFMDASMGSATGTGGSLRNMLFSLWNAIGAVLQMLKPFLALLGGLALTVLKGFAQALGIVFDLVGGAASFIAEGLTNFSDTLAALADAISAVVSVIGKWLGKMAGEILPDWAKSSLSSVSGFIEKAMSWLDRFLDKIFDTDKAIEEATDGVTGGKQKGSGGKKDEKGGEENAASKRLKEFGEGYRKQQAAKRQAKGGKPNPIAGAKNTVPFKSAAGISQSIANEWAKLTCGDTAMTEKWYREQLADLEKSRDANENYERDKLRLTETYGRRRLEALAKERGKEAEIRDSAREAASGLKDARLTLYGSKSRQQIAKMESDFGNAVSAIDSKWGKLSRDFISMTDTEKEVFLKALDEKGVAYEQTASGEISFERAAAQEKLAAYKSCEDQRTEYLAQCEDIRAEIDAAYKSLSLERLQEVLDAESAMRMNRMEAEKLLMDTYQEAYLASHATAMELVAEMASTSLSGLNEAFTNILSGAKSAKDAFQDLGKAMVKTIASYFAQMLSGMLVTAMFGRKQRTAEMSETQAAATAEAAALAPPAWLKLVLHPAAAGVATGLLTQGVGSSVGIGIAAVAAGNATGSAAGAAMSGGSSVAGGGTPKLYAKGGYFTKPLIGVLGDAGDEAALPLNRAVFENIAAGIVEAGGSAESEGRNVTATLNNYGDINNASDLSDLMDGLNAAVLAGLRGA